MSIITSYSVGDGDMFTIKHGDQIFTIIDCCYDDGYMFSAVLDEIRKERSGRKLQYISTHPDEDHIKGIGLLFKTLSVDDFYVVQNRATKDDYSKNFEDYIKIRDGKLVNVIPIECGETAKGGIKFLWPDINNEYFKEALHKAAKGTEFNNISPIIIYSIKNGPQAMWMGDIEHGFLEKVMYNINWPEIDILFAPHHGRSSGSVPGEVLEQLNPKLIVIGEGESDNLDYYQGYDTVTQNRAGDIRLVCSEGLVQIYCSSKTYDPKFKHITQKRNISPTHLGYLKGEFRL